MVNMTDNDAFFAYFSVLLMKWIHFVFVSNVLYFGILKGSRELPIESICLS